MQESIQKALFNILNFWMDHMPDPQNGGFYGKLDNNNKADATAEKGAVLNARILWTFSAAYNATKEITYLDTARRAFSYIDEHFIDKEHGGVFWSVNYKGDPAKTKKQVYAQAFNIYACSEYYKATHHEYAREIAIEGFNLIQQHSLDHSYGGYLEAFTRDWQEISDQRLGEKDLNEPKTMNTHLHILEAYTNLYRIWPEKPLFDAIKSLLGTFYDKMLNQQTGHLNLFFDEHWKIKGEMISYGHDIEASWLLTEAAEVLQEPALIEKFKKVALQMADATMKAIDTDGGLWHEPQMKEKHWWPQAEALVGFLNAWQISKDERYLQTARNSWNFIEKYMIDPEKGEWFWGRKKDYAIMKEDKAGFWKCPYHNGRACLEALKRL